MFRISYSRVSGRNLLQCFSVGWKSKLDHFLDSVGRSSPADQFHGRRLISTGGAGLVFEVMAGKCCRSEVTKSFNPSASTTEPYPSVPEVVHWHVSRSPRALQVEHEE